MFAIYLVCILCLTMILRRAPGIRRVVPAHPIFYSDVTMR